MANQRREGWAVRSYSVPLDLHEAAKAAAERQGVTLSAVIREALASFVTEDEAGDYDPAWRDADD